MSSNHMQDSWDKDWHLLVAGAGTAPLVVLCMNCSVLSFDAFMFYQASSRNNQRLALWTSDGKEGRDSLEYAAPKHL